MSQQNELSYINDQGATVFTSQFLRNKKSCCKSSCLHCPYGFTLNKHGVKVHAISESNEEQGKDLFKQLVQSDSVTNSLISSAFKTKFKTWDKNNFKILSLKNIPCGLVELAQGEFQKHYLLDVFSDQLITDGYVRSII